MLGLSLISINFQDSNEENDFVGKKFRVKYTQEWGTFQYHNVMLMGIEEKPKLESEITETDGVDKEIDYLVISVIIFIIIVIDCNYI